MKKNGLFVSSINKIVVAELLLLPVNKSFDELRFEEACLNMVGAAIIFEQLRPSTKEISLEGVLAEPSPLIAQPSEI